MVLVDLEFYQVEVRKGRRIRRSNMVVTRHARIVLVNNMHIFNLSGIRYPTGVGQGAGKPGKGTKKIIL